MIENKKQRPILIASFSGVLRDASNSPIRRLAYPGVRGSGERPFEPAPPVPRMNCAVAHFTGHESRFTGHEPRSARRCPNQSLAKHNRKPTQMIENKQPRRKSIASFCRVFCDYKGQGVQQKLAATDSKAKSTSPACPSGNQGRPLQSLTLDCGAPAQIFRDAFPASGPGLRRRVRRWCGRRG